MRVDRDVAECLKLTILLVLLVNDLVTVTTTSLAS
jgi:hypothetical protein